MANSTKENLYGLLTNNRDRIYVIAEAGLNHGGSKERALTLVRAAKWAGADAVQFQLFRPARIASTLSAAQLSLQQLSRTTELSRDTFRALFKEAVRLDIDFLSTPFDDGSADFLDELGISAFKIASGDITQRPLIENVSRKGRPVLLSSEMSTSEEIEKAIDWMHTQSNDQIVLLHGVSSYPAQPGELNLKSLEYLRDRFGFPTGFCDHSVGSLAAAVAVALGAQVIERHFRVEARGDAPDLAVSMDAKQLKSHIAELRTIETILGTGVKFASQAESGHHTASPRGLHARSSAVPAEAIEADMLYPVRPLTGIEANTPVR